jgi:hypothetical protein
MRRHTPLVLALALLAAVVPAGSSAGGTVTCPTVKTPKLSFAKPRYIDRNRAGGEPVSIVAQDGSIVVSAHAGTTHIYKNPDAAPGASDFVVGYSNQTLNWRSSDDGKSWQYVGFAGQPAGPHSLTSTGFSDPDLTMDASGRIYNTEIDLANDSVYSSVDDGQSWTYGNAVAGVGDRPWLTGQDPNEVFLYINSTPLHYLQRSTDGGLTFNMVTSNFPATGKLISDPLNPHHGLIGPAGPTGIAISKDDGKTWKKYGGAPLGTSTQFFGAVGVDKAGWVYSAAAGGYTGSTDVTPDGQVTFAYFNRQTKAWNPGRITIPTPKGDALWPWIVAGDDGRATVVWYQSLAGAPTKFYVYAASTENAHGTTVTCSDGSKRFVPPQFSVTNASGRPIHVGDICLQGTACNANTNFQAGDRRLGDFFTVNYDLNGRLFIVSADTELQSALGTSKPVANPIFIQQSSGAPMLTSPIQPKKTPCLYPIPSC